MAATRIKCFTEYRMFRLLPSCGHNFMSFVTVQEPGVCKSDAQVKAEFNRDPRNWGWVLDANSITFVTET